MANLATARAGARATTCVNASIAAISTNSEDSESIGMSNDERSTIGQRTWSSAAQKGKNKAPPTASATSSRPGAGKLNLQPKDLARPTKRLRKERQSNWTQVEISALIQAMREKFFDDLDNQHEPNLMRRDNTKWSQISRRVMEICGELAECNRDSSACKDKWNLLSADYKKIFDSHKASGSNSYWTMSSQERTALHLPRNFQKENYDSIDDWYRNKPIMNALHTRDLSQPGDGIYKQTEATQEDDTHLLDEALFQSLPLHDDLAQEEVAVDKTQARVPAASTLQPDSNPRPGGTHGHCTPSLNTASKACRRGSHLAANGTAPGTSVNLLSSSEASLQEMTRKFGNTGQRRKSLSGHSKIAEATNSSGEKLVTTLEKLNEKESRLKWDMFHEQLKYNRERDLVTQENARLTHANQGNLVQAIIGLTEVLSASLQPPSFPMRSYQQHPLYGPTNLPDHLHYGVSTGYGSTTNRQAPPTYPASQAPPTYPASQAQPTYTATYNATPTYGIPTKPNIVDTTLESTDRDASNGETATLAPAPENLLSANKHAQ